MINKIKMVFIIICILSISLLFNGCSCGCKFNEDPFESMSSGDFIYTLWSCDKGYCRIIGLTEEGKKKETLVFPSIINGLAVETIGAKFGLKSSEQIIITNAKNIYFPAGYSQPQSIKYNNYMNKVNIFIGESKYISWTSSYFGYYIGDSNLNFYIHISDVYYKKYPNLNEILSDASLTEIIGNVHYYINEETTHFIDDVDGTKVNVIPPIPYKEGFKFIGWYKDIDYKEEFDFENDIIPKKEYDEEGNYILKITKIYAKWQKR